MTNQIISNNYTTATYRLTNRDGKPLLMGLSINVEAAVTLAKSRGWRPETASIVTQPKATPTVARKSPKIYQEGLGLDE